jgi:calcineurin-like phosphoesterase family protein
MNIAYIISDTHFGHKNILKYEPIHRPFQSIEEHDQELIRRWNSVVRPRDTVWHLGDVLFGKHSFACLAQLNGTKRLIMGNHDRHPLALYREHFASIHGVAEYKGCILSHIPVHEGQLHSRFRRNIHGHLHSNKLDDPRYICVSAEHLNLTPVPIGDLLK